MSSGNVATNFTTQYYDAFMGGLNWDGLKGQRVWSGGNSSRLVRSWNAYSLTAYTHVRTRASFHYYVPGVVDVWKYGPINSTYRLKTIRTPDAVDDVALWGDAKARVQQHSFNMLVSLGEGNQTIALVLNTLKRLTRSLSLLKRGRAISAANVLVGGRGALGMSTKRRKRLQKLGVSVTSNRVSLSSAWLELQYGWKPLLGDLSEAFKAFYAITGKPRKLEVKSSRVSVGEILPGAGIGYTSVLSKRTRILHVRLTESLSLAGELGLNDPLSLAWEKLPFSFVADWFIPIGNYLSARSFVKQAVGTFAISDIVRLRYEVDTSSLKTLDPYYTGGGEERYSSVSYERSPFTSISSVELNLPGFKPLVKAASAGHVLNAIALLRSLTRVH